MYRTQWQPRSKEEGGKKKEDEYKMGTVQWLQLCQCALYARGLPAPKTAAASTAS